jgi:hypothetical protein
VYTVTGTNGNNCSKSSTTTVVVNALPVISVNSGSICAGKSFTLNAAGAASYTYSSGSNVVSPLTNTSYSVTGTSAQGCVSSYTAVANVTVVSLPNVSVNSGTICAGKTFTMVPSGGVTYTFSSGSSIVSPLANNVYTVTGSNMEGCISLPALSSVTVFALPVITVNSGAICAGGVFTMNPSGAVSYTYSNGSSTVSPLVNSSYTVIESAPQGAFLTPAQCPRSR